MYNALKAAILAIYLLAVVGAFGVLPAGITSILQKIAVILLAAHTLELLFGLLHWKPLAKNP